MSRKREATSGTAQETAQETAVSRRSFFKKGTAAGIGGAAALTTLGRGNAEAQGIKWDEEYDVIVVGSGAAGLPAAIAARDNGASVLVVEKNWDVGGRAMLSGGRVQLGCGNKLQTDAGIKDSPDQFYLDWTASPGQAPVNEKEWGTMGNPLAKLNDREIVRAFADNSIATFEFLTENGVVWQSVGRTRGPGAPETARQLIAKPWPNRAEHIVAGTLGTGLMRPLEKTARAKGVKILLLHRMTQIHRASPHSGHVLGISAQQVDKWNKPTGRTVNLRARKGVILGTGGHSANVTFRRMFDPRLTEEYGVWANAYTTKDADGELAAMAIGASLWTMGSQTNEGERQIHRAGGPLGTRWNGSPTIQPDSPTFFRQVATGLPIGDWQNAIMVKENGKRFYEETLRGKPLGSPGWREHVDAALQWTGDPAKPNGGGPIWAIFDSAAVERERWKTEPPYVDRDGGYFFSADTIEELASKIKKCHYQWRPMPGDVLRATVERYNSFVDSGVDADFGKPTPTYKIARPPFFAGWATPTLHDVMSGLRINVNGQVMDLHGEIIPGLYAAGECASGISIHGMAKGMLFGRLAGIHAARQSATS